MARQGLRAKGARKYKATPPSNHSLPGAENPLQQNFSADRPNAKWVSDITDIAPDEGGLYWAVVMDVYSRIVVGWSMSERMTVQLTGDALRRALFRRHRPCGVMVHSERGSPYGAHEYQALRREHGWICSRSAQGNCYDNAAQVSVVAGKDQRLTEFYHRRACAVTS